jgi:hypothetical protein
VDEEQMVNLNALKIHHPMKTRHCSAGHYRWIAAKDSWKGAGPKQTRQVREMGQGAGMLEKTDPPHLGVKHGFHCLMTERQNRYPNGSQYH